MTAASPSPPHPRYDATARFFHWTMAALILAAFVLALVFDDAPKAVEYVLVQLHMIIGLAIIALYLGRVAWRLVHTPPPLPADMGPGMQRAAKLAHLALYAMMIVVPLTGLALTALRGRGIDFGLFQIPSPIAADRALARPAKEVHELAAYGLIGLATLHAGAALWHHVVRRDGVLRSMMPAR